MMYEATDMQDLTVGVVGFGTMGRGIVEVCASAGAKTVVVEPNSAVIERDLKAIEKNLAKKVEKGSLTAEKAKETIALIKPNSDLEAVENTNLVIEAVPERLELKQSIFKRLSDITAADTILATNTSALSVTEIAASADHPERVLGLHWFNPANILPLVEVVKAERTSSDVVDKAVTIVKAFGKSPIQCNDTPGFVVNRILIPMLNDVTQLWDQGLASAHDIDNGCKLGLNWPIGPLALCDLIGIDVAVNAANALYAATKEPKMAAPPVMQRMVAAGKLGRKTGEGFYSY